MRRRGVIGYRDWEYKLLNNNQRINFIKNKGEELNYLHICNLLEYSENKDDISTKIIEVKGEKLDDSEVRSLMTKKYFNIAYWDKLRGMSEGTHWDLENMVELFAGCGV